MEQNETLYPKYRNLGRSRAQRLPKPPSVGSRSQYEKKKRKKGVLGPSAKIEMSAGQITSPACTSNRKPAVDSCRRRKSIKIRMPFAR